MTITVFYIFASILAVSLVSVVGIFFLFLKDRILREFNIALLGLAVGALLGGALLHLIPELFEEGPSTSNSLFILLGIFAFFFLEKFMHWHHSHSTHAIEDRSCKSCQKELPEKPKPLGTMVIYSDALHNMLDGVLISSAFLLSTEAGLATTLAVLLHEIPQEIADFGVLLHAGYSKLKAILYNFLSALSAFLGAFLVLFAQSWTESVLPLLSAFAAGSLLYIAMSDLIPELHEHKKIKDAALQFGMIAVGVFIMLALKFLE